MNNATAPVATTTAALDGWHEFYRLLAVGGIFGLALLAVPTMTEIVDVRANTLGAFPPLIFACLLTAAAYHPRAHVRLLIAGVAIMFAVLAIFGLLPICPDAPWAPRLARRLRRGELLWRVAIGPTAFAFAIAGAWAWCAEELRRLNLAAQARAQQPQRFADPASDAGLTATQPQLPPTPCHAITPYRNRTLMAGLALLPIFAFALCGSALTAGLMSHSTYTFPQVQGILWLFPTGMAGALAYGLIYGTERTKTIACGASAGLCLSGLCFFAVILIYGMVNLGNRSVHEMFALSLPFVAALLGCLYAAVALLPLQLPALLIQQRPPPKPPKLPPEEDLGADAGWDEASRP